ncbi:hypothetical protein MD484_g8570, partial [Candolleomyces efflorescens]
MSTHELERAAFNSYRVTQKWVSMAKGDFDPRVFYTCEKVRIFKAHNDSVSVREVFFLPHGIHGHNLMLTVSKKIWSVLRVWMVNEVGDPMGEWGRRGVLFKNIAVNQDSESQVTVAVGMVTAEGQHTVEFLKLTPSFSFETVCSLETNLSPIALKGDLVALCDAKSKTAIFNWATSGYALLDDDDGDDSDSLRAKYVHQVVFAHESVLVARFLSLSLFAMPELHPGYHENAMAHRPLSKFEYGTQDGMCISLSNDLKSCKIIMREGSDPWRPQDDINLRVYDLPFNPDYYRQSPPELEDPPETQSPPYLFPPRLKATIPTSRGRLVATGIRLGKCGTALWVKPKPWRGVAEGMVTMPYIVPELEPPRLPSEDEREKEYVMGAVLWDSALRGDTDGSLVSADEPIVLKPFEMKTNGKREDWTCMDYDEETGMFALGHEDGAVTLCSM